MNENTPRKSKGSSRRGYLKGIWQGLSTRCFSPEVYGCANRMGSAQYVFPSKSLSKDPRSGVIRRHHAHETTLQKSVYAARERVGITKRVSCHTLRHSFATHLLESGVNIRILQELLVYKDVSTTERYTHVMNKDISGIKSPLIGLKE